MSAGPERTIASGDARICTQAFGAPGDPPVLLIMGAMASMLWWPEELCERLAAARRFVIRYDNRDTGRSTHYTSGEPPYTLDDFAGDAVAVLDAHGIESAHLVGMSMGGVVAQLIAVEHHERVRSVTAISTTKLGEPDPELPGPTPEYMQHAAAFEDLDPSDTAALAELLVRDAQAIAGRHPFDEAAARELVARDLARMEDPATLLNHAQLGGGQESDYRLDEFNSPLLVIHGTADPLFPHEHGVALAREVPGATLLGIDGGGHELHEDDWDQILNAIVAHTAPG